jgi:hypothetical protein
MYEYNSGDQTKKVGMTGGKCVALMGDLQVDERITFNLFLKNRK